MDEFRRCMEDLGFVGAGEVYNDYRINEPVYFPLLELAIKMGVPFLEHAGHPGWLDVSQPRISDGKAFADVAKRYPEAMIICGHLCGGGDWEWELEALRDSPSVYLDLSGSIVDEGTAERAVEMLGADRLLFACDNSFTASMGRMRSAHISQADKDKIYGLNWEKMMRRRKV